MLHEFEYDDIFNKKIKFFKNNRKIRNTDNVEQKIRKNQLEEYQKYILNIKKIILSLS